MMGLAQLLSLYVAFNALVVVGYLSLRALARRISASQELHLHYALLSSIFLIGAVLPWLPHKNFLAPAARVWASPSLKNFANDYQAPHTGGYLSLPLRTHVISADLVTWLLLAFFAASIIVGAYKLARDLYALWRLNRNAHELRRIGRVRLSVHDAIAVPFSYWLPGRAQVVLPTSILAQAQDCRIAVAHELQHHRQCDTIWVHLMWVLRTACAINPAAHLWSGYLTELQEFACDETLVDRKKVESRQYARCLIEVAETASRLGRSPARATGGVFLAERKLLKRRIERMFHPPKIFRNRSIPAAIGTLSLALVAATAFAAQGFVQDRRVSQADAEKMAAIARSGSEFPLVVNDMVLKQLNRYIGTPEGRDFMRQSLQRMQAFQPLVESKIKEYDVPPELMAIPVIESGYRNLEEKHRHGRGAGLWMFIASTARKFGLRVDDQVDERMNTEVLSDAAMRLLKADQLQFNDWALAILAYNVGEGAVAKAISDTGTRDAWTLVRRGYQNDRDYLPSVVAAAIILKNPDSVQ